MTGIRKLKLICGVVVLICSFCHVAKADTKVLKNIYVSAEKRSFPNEDSHFEPIPPIPPIRPHFEKPKLEKPYFEKPFCDFCDVAEIDKNVLRDFFVSTGGFPHRDSRQETISLDNDQNLVVKGQTVQDFGIEKDADNVYVVILNYDADKNGNRVTYKLTRQKFDPIPNPMPKLSISTLKSSGG